MKTTSFLFAILLAAGLSNGQAQNTWIQKVDFGGTTRWGAVGFSIGATGYLGTGGEGFPIFYKDFWKYDPATNTWTQKADFGGGERFAAVGFSIGNKGYIGTGLDVNGFRKDFWEYDPAGNTWTKKKDFGGTERDAAVGFSLGTKGYIGTGYNDEEIYKDLWEYDPNTNVWQQKANLEGSARYFAVGFSIGIKGYIGTGTTTGDYKKDFWEYDANTDTWSQKSDFGGVARWTAIGFSISDKGYIGMGVGAENPFLKKDFWEYDPSTDVWIQKAHFEGSGRYGATAFNLAGRGYVGTGLDTSPRNDFWEYIPDVSSCAVPLNLSVTDITSSSATLKWDAVPEAQRYKLRYKITGSNTWTTITNISSNSKKVSGLISNTSYTWQVKSVCSANPIVSSEWSSKQTFTTGSERIIDEPLQQISVQIYPNPARDHATIQLTLSQSSHIILKVHDVSGKEIATLLDSELQQGMHSLQLNTHQFSKGVYNVRIVGDFGTVNQKLIVQ